MRLSVSVTKIFCAVVANVYVVSDVVMRLEDVGEGMVALEGIECSDAKDEEPQSSGAEMISTLHYSGKVTVS